jgi:uncharacterized protein (TIGR02246 family)
VPTGEKGEMMRLTLIAMLLPVVWIGAVLAGPEDEIAALAQKQSEAFTQDNVDWYVEAFADDAVLSPPGGVARAVGKKAIRSAFARFFELFPTRESIPSETIIRVYNNGTVAIRNEYRDEKLVDRDGKATTQKTRFTQVLVDDGDGWLVVEQHNSRLPPNTSSTVKPD